MPPSMTSSAPVTKDDSSEARYNTPAAMSSGIPMRPKGVLPTLSCQTSGMEWKVWVIGLST